MNAISTTKCSLPWPSDDELEMIVQKAAGLFIFATTVVKYVGMDYGSPVTRLQAVLQAFQNSASAESAVVHSPLDMLYSDALRAIPDLEKVRLVLGTVVFSFQPLSTRGLNDLIWTCHFDASYIVKNLSSVLTISDSDIEGDGAIRFYHTSFRDFLTTSNRSGQYFVDPAVFHSILGRAVFRVDDPTSRRRYAQFRRPRCELHIREGVRYACRWFAHHVSQVRWDREVDNALLLCVQGFARRCLLNWIEVLSLTGALDSAVLSLREVAEWLKVGVTVYRVVTAETYYSAPRNHMMKHSHYFWMRKD
ncbi:hypothetical protein JVU11DRAFT_6860 [Chiua virens]|nr:hypothetical protein JVU11DRAFT_6860 [Chiua virens]